MDRDMLEQAASPRVRYAKHMHGARSSEQCLERFTKLQQASFEVLVASPTGYQNFLRRNFRSRRVKVVDGKYQPVSSARRTLLP